MIRSPRVQYAILGCGLMVLLAILAWRFWPDARPKSPEELARLALEAPTPDEQERAAVRLAELGPEATSHLRRVLSESQSSAVRAACIRGLAARRDYDSMPEFLKALEDESPLVRGRAGVAVQKLLGADCGYRQDLPQRQHQAAVKALRKEWERLKDSEMMQDWIRRQQAEP